MTKAITFSATFIETFKKDRAKKRAAAREIRVNPTPAKANVARPSKIQKKKKAVVPTVVIEEIGPAEDEEIDPKVEAWIAYARDQMAKERLVRKQQFEVAEKERKRKEKTRDAEATQLVKTRRLLN